MEMDKSEFSADVRSRTCEEHRYQMPIPLEDTILIVMRHVWP